ncbi:phosphoprotein [avian paramyxovirus 20]|uniref:Phosphoprotein n=1 Tax=avian paramyxovirus 20 TaxID=2560314 RepID=A0A2I6ECF1_9MONO|nr:phosphoprotein [Avian metaavulavirus 20]AUJ87604.1 phosphoprotein [Avian metaavulavirus 20]
MDFSNDDDIAELLNVSSQVIREIQHAEGKPPQTVGSVKVSPGNTKTLTELWESEASQSQAAGPSDKSSGESSNQPNPPQTNQTHNEEDSAELDTITAATTTCNDNEDTTQQSSQGIKSNMGKDLDSALAKLEKKAASIKSDKQVLKGGEKINSQSRNPIVPRGSIAGQTQVSNHSHPIPPKAPVQSPDYVGSTGNQSAVNVHLDHSGFLGTEESMRFPQIMASHTSPAGVTQSALQSEQIQESSNADAAIVHQSASYAETILHSDSMVLGRLAKIDEKLSEIMKIIGIIPSIKNDINQLKATTALLSNQLAAIQILDPGNAQCKSLNEMRAASRSATVVVSGPGELSPQLVSDKIICKNELGQPIPREEYRASQPTKSSPNMVTDAELESLQALIETLVEPGKKRDRLVSQLTKVKTKDDWNRLKRAIYNS